MFIKKLLAAALLTLTLGVAAQPIQTYVKPCMIQVSPTTWVNMNDLFSLSWSSDGTTVIAQFKDGKELRYTIPADQARNYVVRALSSLEACRR